MPFNITLFSDLIDALGNVAGAVRSIASLPAAERDKYRQVLDDTYRMIDTTLNMVIIRLGDILLEDDPTFVLSAAKLDNYMEWIQAEREFRLCKSLRLAFNDTSRLLSQLKGRISEKDWNALTTEMLHVLAGEGEIGTYISFKLSSIAQLAHKTADPQAIATLREQVTQFRQALLAEREQLTQQEAELYTALV